LNAQRGPHRVRKRTAGLFFLAALLLSACGSTLPEGTTAAGNDQLTGGVPAAVAPTQTGGIAPTANASTVATPGTTGAAPRTDGPALTSGAAGGLGAGTLDIGVYTATGATKFYGDLGLKGLNFGDHQRQTKAVVDWINANGGAGGKKLRIVFHDFNIARAATDAAGETQSACEDWTQDQKVYAVVNPIANAYMDQLATCLEKHGVISINNSAMVDERFMKRHAAHFY
jgi:hypothetical protein